MKLPVPHPIPALAELGRVHLIGIGGAGLSAIARLMLARGVVVSGSDAADSPLLRSLARAGAKVQLGHDPALLAGVDSVVVSTAIAPDNPELVAAQRRGLRVLPRSAGLAAVMQGSRVLAVAGTHGKTTTSSLLTMALRQVGADPTFAIGGELAQLGTNAALGGGELFIAEADESDGAFLVYEPWAAIVTNVDADHLDQWGTVEAYRAAFERFATQVHAGGFLICCTDDPGAAALAAASRAAGRRVITVGQHAGCDLRLRDLRRDGARWTFNVVRDGAAIGRVSLAIPGAHYAVDALAALAMGLELGHELQPLAQGLARFEGTRRRMEAKGEAHGVRVIDSYAHHPSEIACDLAAARALAGGGRLLVAFQPHLVSRTRIFGAAMGRALAAADEVVVLDVYLARETADPAVTAALVADAVPLPAAQVRRASGIDEAALELVALARSGDLVLTLGAGDITQLGARVLSLLAARD